MHSDPQPLTDTGDDDAHWADLLSPARRRLIASAGLAAGGLASASTATAAP
ncbi:TPA: aromatic ring-cleaving dioxygenase, partial [Stenotrophomonas maltophilia]